MTITINYRQRPTPGYVPRKPDTIHNVESVRDNGPHAVELRMMFTDFRPAFTHVASVSIRPADEELEDEE